VSTPSAARPSPTRDRWRTLAARARRGLARLRTNALLTAQVGVAASLSWLIANNLLHHRSAFFAPIGAVIVLTGTAGHRLRRGIELVAGVAIGIAAGDLLVSAIGVGAWQLGLIVVIAVAGALFIGGGVLLVNQAAGSAVLIATLFPPSNGIYYSRWIDALVGGAIAFTVHALLLPLNPLTLVRKSVTPVLRLLTGTLVRLSQALATRDLTTAEELLDTVRRSGPTVEVFTDSLRGASDVVLVSPFRFRARGPLALYLVAGPQLDLAVRNTRVLLRQSVALLRNDEPLPNDIEVAVGLLAEAFAWLGRELASGHEPDAARGRAVSALQLGYRALGAPLSLSGTAIVAQIRALAFDLMLASGLDPAAARAESQHARHLAEPDAA
jgi:hypothetical protein